jgi:arylsulfatase A-like enzyme
MDSKQLIAIFIFGILSLLVNSYGQVQGQGQDSNDGGDGPNFLVIVADDLGFSDIGAFGSEISTPNLDALARDGKVLSNFHVLPSCSPTRSELLTGVDNHLNGFGAMYEVISPAQMGKPGYETYLNDKVVTIAEILDNAGYHTIMSGKWHLSKPEPVNGTYLSEPSKRGFEKSFTLLDAMANHFNGNTPCSECGRPIFLKNGKMIERQNGVYSSDLYTDEMISFINEVRGDNKPLFLYLAFQVTHLPFQAPSAITEKYSNLYEQGWDVIRNDRFDRQKDLGIWPSDMELPKRFPPQRDWDDTLTETNRKQINWVKNMKINAAMVDNMDHNVGRLINFLKEIGEYDNTFILFTSDNGGVNASVGINSASVAPLSGFKGTMYEGGIRSPLLVKHPYTSDDNKGSNDTRKVIRSFTHVLDVLPTILDYAGEHHPDGMNQPTSLEFHTGSKSKENKIYEPMGKSIRPLIEDELIEIHKDDEPLSQELFGNSVVFMGNWKAIRHIPPAGNGEWHLYDIARDPAETNNLSEGYPDILKKMVASYERYYNEINIVPSDVRGMPLALYGKLSEHTR